MAHATKSEIWWKVVGLTQSVEAKSFGLARFGLGIAFLDFWQV